MNNSGFTQNRLTVDPGLKKSKKKRKAKKIKRKRKNIKPTKKETTVLQNLNLLDQGLIYYKLYF
jgi:hypothetical protein